MVFNRYLERKDLPRLLSAKFLLIITNIAAIYFFIWLSKNIIWSVYSYFYIFAEFMALIHFDFTAISYINMRFHRRQPPLQYFNPTVDVFITYCNEDIEIIERTIAGALDIDYKNKKIYILDDSRSVEVMKLANASGCGYITREGKSGFKAGNLNNAMKYSSGEFILVLDADQVAKPYIIKKLIGYFVRPEVAFVQSTQTHDTPPGDPYNSQDAIFNRSVELSKDAKNSIISCGSGVIYRRKSIDKIEGFSSWNLVEDLHTSYKLQQAGYIGIFYNYALSKGVAPSRYAQVAKQRHKWATDTLRIFLWDNPLFKKGLSFIQKINYLNLGILYIFTGFCMPIFFILPIWSLLTNRFIISTPASEYLIYRMPYFALLLILNNFVFRTKNMPKVYQTWNFFFPIFIKGFIDAIRNKKLKIDVMVTGESRDISKIPWWASANLQLCILIAYIASLFYAIYAYNINKDILFINSIWMLWAAFILLPLSMHVFLEQHANIKNLGAFYSTSNKVAIGALGAILVFVLVNFAMPVSTGKQIIISQEEQEAESLLNRARLHAQVKDYQDAQKLYLSYLKLYPVDVTARREYATLLHIMKEYDLSAKQYEFLIDNDLAEKEDYLQYARVLSWKGDYDKSFVSYDMLLAKYPNDAIIKQEHKKVLNYKASFARATEKESIDEPITTPAIKTKAEQTEILLAKEDSEAKFYNYELKPMFSLYWQDTDYRRINQGLNFKAGLDKTSNFEFIYSYSHFRNGSRDHLARNSFRIGIDKGLSESMSLHTDVGLNSFTDSVGETFAAKSRLTIEQEKGNLAFEYSRFDIIDTINIFAPRYYTLVTDIQSARHKIVTNDFKAEIYRGFDNALAIYANIVYGKYTDNNIKRSSYASLIYSLDPNQNIKYGFAYIDVRNSSPYYFAHDDSKIHQISYELIKAINDRVSFKTEEVLSFDVAKGIGASTFLTFSYKLKENMYFDVSTTYSFAKDNDANNNLHSINFNSSLKVQF